jgi:hypothetical protein
MNSLEDHTSMKRLQLATNQVGVVCNRPHAKAFPQQPSKELQILVMPHFQTSSIHQLHTADIHFLKSITNYLAPMAD